MCCFVLALGFLGPRFALFVVWLSSGRIDAAFGSWLWPVLGFLFLPWTTLMYVLAWGPLQGVSGAGWILVALGVAADLATYSARESKKRYAAYRGA
jgi:hypothetical protein